MPDAYDAAVIRWSAIAPTLSGRSSEKRKLEVTLGPLPDDHFLRRPRPHLPSRVAMILAVLGGSGLLLRGCVVGSYETALEPVSILALGAAVLFLLHREETARWRFRRVLGESENKGPDQMIPLLQTALRMEVNRAHHLGLLCRLAEVTLWHGDSSEALRLLRVLWRRSREGAFRSHVASMASLILALRGQVDEAADWLNEARVEHGSHQPPLEPICQAALLLRSGHAKEALRHCEKGRELIQSTEPLWMPTLRAMEIFAREALGEKSRALPGLTPGYLAFLRQAREH